MPYDLIVGIWGFYGGGWRMMLLGLRRCMLVVCMTCVVVGGCLCSVPVAVGSVDLPACEAKDATIESVRMLSLSAAGVSFEAEINPEGTETTYGFLIIGRQVHFSESPERLSGLVQDGRIAAGTSTVDVTAFLSGLQQGYVYWLEVTATSLAGTVRSTPGHFFYDDPSAEGERASNPWPYIPNDRAGCWNESGALAAAETLREQREKEAAEAKAVKEREAREVDERAGREEAQRASECVVPRLKGDTLVEARRALEKARCSLGRITKPRSRRGRLIVVKQSVRSGSKLASGSRVALMLGLSVRRGSR